MAEFTSLPQEFPDPFLNHSLSCFRHVNEVNHWQKHVAGWKGTEGRIRGKDGYLHQLPISAVTSGRKTSGLKQHILIVLQFCGWKSDKDITGAAIPSGGSRGESLPCHFQFLEAACTFGSRPFPPSPVGNIGVSLTRLAITYLWPQLGEVLCF